MRRAVLGILGAAVLACGGWAAWPGPIDPLAIEVPPHDAAAWSPSPWPETRRTALPDGHGPEDIEVDPQGRIYAGLADGRILRWDSPDQPPITLADTGGRPLGLHWSPDGALLVADAFAGLLAVDRDTGTFRVLTTSCGGRPLVFTDDLDVTADGTVWFSDASTVYPQSAWKLDMIEGRPNGRLCRWREGWSEAAQVLGDLWFANGVALDPRGRFVMVVETSRHRVRKLWITGLDAGGDEVVIDDLPGYPDGISTGHGGVYWIAVASPRKPELDALGPYPFVRRLIAKLPDALQPAPVPTSRVIGIDADGQVVHDLFDPEGTGIGVVTSVQERGDRLWLGSLVDHAFADIPLPAPPGR